MTHRDYVLAALRHEQTDRVPYTLGFEGGTDKQLDEFYGSTAWRGTIKEYLRCAAWFNTTPETPVGENIARDAFGSVWRTDKVLHLEKPALPEPDFDGIVWPTADAFPIHRFPGEPGDTRFTFIALGWGLFEQSWRIHGFENVMASCVLNEEFYEELLDRLTTLYLDCVERCRDINADAILFGDDWGDQRGVIIGPDRWRRLLKPRWAKIYAAARAQGKFVLSHCCGSVVDIMPDMIEIGLDALESVQPEATGMNPFELKKKSNGKLAFWGCVGSQSDIPFGTPASIRSRVRELCAVMGKGGGYILAPAKPVQPGAPVENIAALAESFAEQSR